ncbi:hypothetical protein HGRIS_002768 [Hohenbuehelia grisea]|uniref:Uncharacterized protein n=1 Tax=Hohenbuehelia grisea TaxID=104357 RepID=A0ABR3JM01_9AGAR
MAEIDTFDVDDTSPSISYSPFADTLTTPNLLAGWNPYFDVSGFAAAPGDVGNGTSMHITALNGASVSLQWQGTGVQVFGNATQASYSITLDGVAQPNSSTPQGSILASFSDLQNTNHTIQLTAQTASPQSVDSFIVLDKFTVSSPSLPDFTRQPLPDQSVAFHGPWSFQKDTLGNSSSHESTTKDDRASTQFIGSAVFLHGGISPNAASYRVVLDGSSTTLSAKSSFSQADTLLFFATGLDANTTHSIEVFNADGRDLSVQADGFIVTSNGNPIPPQPTPTPSPPPPSPSPVSGAAASTSFPKGTIAAFILAGILAFILLSLLLLFVFVVLPRRRRRAAQSLHDPSSKELEAADVLDICPQEPAGEFSAGRVGFVGGGARGNGSNAEWWRDRARRESNGSRRSRRTSGRSGKTGFARWKEEVESGFGGRGLMGIGLAFRHSFSVGGGGTIRDQDEDEEDASEKEKEADVEDKGKGKAEAEPQSSGTSTSSGGPPLAIKEKRRSKSSRRIPKPKRKSSSPSFTIDLPLPTLLHNNGHSSRPSSRVHSRSNSGSAQSALLAVPRSHSGSTGTRTSQQGRVSHLSESSPALSYISAPALPSPDQPSPVQSQAPAPEAVLPIGSSRPESSIPGRRSLPVRPLPVPGSSLSPVSRPNHSRTDSNGFLLQHGDSQLSSPDDDPYEPVHIAATAPFVSPPDTIEEEDERAASRGLLQPPSMPRADRGSVSSGYMTDMDGLVRAETTSGQVAVRSLSPRTAQSPSDWPMESVTTPTLRVDTQVQKPLPQPVLKKPSLPEVQATSPLDIDFWASSPEDPTPRMSVRFQTAGGSRALPNPHQVPETSPTSASTTNSRVFRALPHPPTLQLKSSFRLTPMAMPGAPSPEQSDSEGVTSFLDFAGSSDASVMTQTNDSSSHRRSQSRWSGPSMITSLHKKPSIARNDYTPVASSSGTRHEPGPSQPSSESRQRSQSHSQSESSGQGSSSSGNFPFPVSLPPSPHHPPGSYVFTQPLVASPPDSPQDLPSVPRLNIIDSSPHSSTLAVRPRHPSALGVPTPPEAISPTESIPMSVSDIHFRHSDSDSAGDAMSRRESTVSHLPPHPPLPGHTSMTEETMDPASAASAQFIVQRVLGRSPAPSPGVGVMWLRALQIPAVEAL